VVIEHSRHGGQSQAIPKPSRLLPNVAVMPVLGISPSGILSHLLIHDFQGYPLCYLQAACDRRGFRELAVEVPGYFSRLVGFRVDPNPDRNSFVLGKPILRGSALPPHKPSFSVLSPVLRVPESVAKLLSGDSADDFQLVVSKEATFFG
jgi:hypothetical protein